MTTSVALDVAARPEIQRLAASRIREIANAAMGRPDVLPFWFGESDQPTPRFIRDEAIRSLGDGQTFYSQNLGRPYLREAIAAYLGRLHGRPVAVERIAAVGSGVLALLIASELVLSPEARVVAVTPLWPNVFEIPKILSARVSRVPLVVRNGAWRLDLDRLLAALPPGTSALMLNSPNNPTGWTIDEEEVSAILAHCRRHGIWIICDDVYERLVFDPALASAPSFLRRYEPGDRIIGTNSFSKAWSMTGWRVGWMVIPETLRSDLEKVIEYNFSCIFEPVQKAATLALRDGEAEVARLRAHLRNNYGVLQRALSSFAGVEVPDAGGAMYAFFRLDGYADSVQLARKLVEDVGLGLAPGLAFGPEGEGWLRWCHAVEEKKLAAGIDRLRQFMEKEGR